MKFLDIFSPYYESLKNYEIGEPVVDSHKGQRLFTLPPSSTDSDDHPPKVSFLGVQVGLLTSIRCRPECL